MHGLKIGCAWITHIKDHQAVMDRAAAVVTRHFHLRRALQSLTCFHRDRLAPLHFQCECAFQDINSDWKTVCVEHSFIARFEARVRTRTSCLTPLGIPWMTSLKE